MRGLKDKVAIVTGGPGAIGSNTCWRLAEEGCKIMIADIALDKAEELAAKLREKGFIADACYLNLKDPDSIQAMVDTTVERFGTVDILVNLAYGAHLQMEDSVTPFHQLRPEFFLEVMQTNALGYTLTCQKVLPIFLKKQAGAIVNISSTAAIEGNACRFAYSASKAAIMTLAMNIACAYGKMGIRCNTVLPGFIVPDGVPLDAAYPGDIGISMKESLMVPDIGKGADIASVVAFLASDDSAFINGDHILVDGGHHIPNPMQPTVNMHKDLISPFYPKSYKLEDYPEGLPEL